MTPDQLRRRLEGALSDWKSSNRGDQLAAARRRHRVNCVPILGAIFLPWIVFLGVYLLIAFQVHYIAPISTNVAMACLLGLVIHYARWSYQLYRGGNDWFFHIYLSAGFLLVILLSWALADYQFWHWLQPAFNAEHMATYVNVDPSTETTRSGVVVATPGKRYQDAGRIFFSSDTVLDFNKSMSFKLGKLYCVTPIVNKNCKKNCGYDFWAVGIDCCSEDAADFRCGEYRNPKAKAGIRAMYEWERPFYRLAVLEAEGVHDIMSKHPMFFQWVQDPIATVHRWQNIGYKRFIISMFLVFGFNALTLAVALKFRTDKMVEEMRTLESTKF
jgi:Ca2+/Na+ antiporter